MLIFIRLFLVGIVIAPSSYIAAQEPLKVFPEKDTYRSQSQREASPTLIVGDNGSFTALLTFQLPTDLAVEAIDSVHFVFAPVIENGENRLTRSDVMQFFTCSKDDWNGEFLTTVSFPLYEKWLSNYTITPRSGYGSLHIVNISDYVRQEVAGDRRVSLLFTKWNREFTRFAASEWPEERWRPHLLIFLTRTTAIDQAATLLSPIHVFPNPVSDVLHLQMPNYDANITPQLKLLNANGAVFIQGLLSQSATELHLSVLPSGWYLLQIQVHDRLMTKRILKVNHP